MVTYAPVPIRLYPFVTALALEHVLEVLNVVPVPGEEHSREMNLWIGIRIRKTQRTTRNETYLAAEIHMHIDQV